jgi:hypothetical protein
MILNQSVGFEFRYGFRRFLPGLLQVADGAALPGLAGNKICYTTREPLLVLAGNVLQSFLSRDLPAIIKHKLQKNARK